MPLALTCLSLLWVSLKYARPVKSNYTSTVILSILMSFILLKSGNSFQDFEQRSSSSLGNSTNFINRKVKILFEIHHFMSVVFCLRAKCQIMLCIMSMGWSTGVKGHWFHIGIKVFKALLDLRFIGIQHLMNMHAFVCGCFAYIWLAREQFLS